MIKNKNNKYILYTLISLSLISVVSVGFSSWIINNSKGDTTENFNITFATDCLLYRVDKLFGCCRNRRAASQNLCRRL